MTIETTLHARSDGKCELCGTVEDPGIYVVPPGADQSADQCLLICKTCLGQIEAAQELDKYHWRCLSDSMWSDVPAVQVMAWRLLRRLSAEDWARDLLDMLYLDDETLHWAQAMGDDGIDGGGDDAGARHVDSNGAMLKTGDTVTLIKDLNVKGAGFTAKRGTSVRGISLVADNERQIEGRIEGQQIVILTEFVKKSG